MGSSSNKTQMQQSRGRRVVLFPVPLQGHINPMLQLGNILHSKGFSITVIHTKFNSPNQSKYPHFTFQPIPDGLSENQVFTPDVLSLFTVLNINCVAPFRDCMTRLLEEPIACLITDAIWHFTQAVADSLGLPRIVLRTSSLSSFLAFAAFPLLRKKGYLPKQDSQLAALVPELPPLRVRDIPTIGTDLPEDLYQLIECMIKEIKASSGLIWNSFEELEQPALATLGQDFPIPVFPIGPFHKYFPASSSSLLAQDQSSISWLDKQAPKSVIYVSFGSIAAMDETEFLEMAWGLANSLQPFLWVVRPGLIRGSEWIEPLPDGFMEAVSGRGHIVKWAPQQEVLAHSATGGFWTHNGWNSTLESICEGVPMICSPCFGDQMVNARYVSHVWRVGVQLENGLEREEVEKGIKRLMVEREGEEMRERIMCLKEKVNLCLEHGGSSYQSLESLISYMLSF
uniref:Putative UDP-glycosyltransferase 76C4 n=1 Tax=Davidia involucrata TaxID=16924 RepID=A0A5B7B0C1_DAVIN